MALPGDDLVPAPMVQATHAVTINALGHPGNLEAMKPGRMQGHGGTAEIPG